MDVEQIPCPVCQIEFPSTLINSHVKKCLFLSDSNTAGISKKSNRSPASQSLKSKNVPIKKSGNKITKRKISPGQTFFIKKDDSKKQDLEIKEKVINYNLIHSSIFVRPNYYNRQM